jgi:hypothetical protein
VSRKSLIAALAVAAAALALALLSTRGAPTPRARRAGACTETIGHNASAAAIASAIVSAADGTTICLASGSFPHVEVIGATHGAYVTVRPAPGAVAKVAGIEVRDSSFLRFQGLQMTEGFNMRDANTYSGSHDYQFIENTFDEPLYGIVLGGGSGPIKRVLIEKNYMHRVHLTNAGAQGKCEAGYAAGQDVTIFYAEGVTIAHNVFNEAAWHYLQGGAAGPEGVDVEHNLFEGHELLACSHLNLWQIWGGGEHDTFKDNIAVGDGTGEAAGRSQEAATDGLIFENGAGSANCAIKMRATVIENNLFVDAASSFAIQIYTTEDATIEYNTVVRSQYGSGLLTEKCGPSTDSVMTHNIDVENTGTTTAFAFQCVDACLFDYNVSDDASASLLGASHVQTGWKPAWVSTAWNRQTEATPPAGYYVASGLPFAAGYLGGGGP